MAFKMNGWSAFTKDDKQTAANPDKDSKVTNLTEEEEELKLKKKRRDRVTENVNRHLTELDQQHLPLVDLSKAEGYDKNKEGYGLNKRDEYFSK